MLEVQITQPMLEAAKLKAKELGELRNSITRGEGNLAGFLGELVVQSVCGGELKNTRDFDLLLEDGTKVDVKTKRCRDEPEPHYECSIAAFNTTQKCDKYIFVRVQNDYSKAWIVGEAEKEEYFRRATFIQRGQYDPRNRWRCQADCYNVPVSELDELTLTPSGNGTPDDSACSQTLPESPQSC